MPWILMPVLQRLWSHIGSYLLPNFSCLANYKGKLFDLFLDWSATFLTERDRLLRDDFPRPEQYRSMSEGESQEKMVLWKLRCSARRQKTSSTGNMMDTQGIFPFPTVKMAMSKGSNALKLVGAYPQFVSQEVTMATLLAISGWDACLLQLGSRLLTILTHFCVFYFHKFQSKMFFSRWRRSYAQ